MITTTGNPGVDQATAEIAVALRDASPGKRDQDYYNEAMRLRDAILSGAREAPVQERAPEVTELLARIREQERENDGGWPGGDTVDILIVWFGENGYDIDSPLPPEDDDDDQECGSCGETVEYLSSRGWCDGCEEEADQRPCETCGAGPGEDCRPDGQLPPGPQRHA
jgi:hypothetical protein